MTNNTTTSFNKDFCMILEYHLSKTLQNLGINKFERFWCDGVAMPFEDAQLTKINISNAQKITTSAWMGLTGQDNYQMTIQLGPLSLNKCLNDESLNDCLPDSNSTKWITLDIALKTIEILLK